MTKASYDPVKDFAPISNIGVNPFVLMVHPSFPVTTVAEFVARARAGAEHGSPMAAAAMAASAT